MKCKCGFENAADARFCGSCRAALGGGHGSAVPSASVLSTPAPVPAVAVQAAARPFSLARLAIVVAVVVAAGAGYWWMNRPPGPYKPDNSGLYRISGDDGKYGFMDRSGKTVIPPQFDETWGDFSEGLAAVKIGTKWGYINTKGMVAITPQFDDAGPFRYGRAVVGLGNRYGFIDKDGKYISSPNFLYAERFSGDLAAVRTADGLGAFVNRSGQLVHAGKFEKVGNFHEGLAPAASGGKWGYIEESGEWVITPQFEEAREFWGGLARVVVGGRAGYVDHQGHFVINLQYESFLETAFTEGLARFAIQNPSDSYRLGFIDATGRVVVEPKFQNAGEFNEGLAPVKIEDGWGFIDPTGKMVIDPQFEEAQSFMDGLAFVVVLGKQAWITKTGAFVVDPFPGSTIQQERARLQQAERDAQIDMPQEIMDEVELVTDAVEHEMDDIGIAKNEASAAGSLRTFATSNVTYLTSYYIGYAGTLAHFGSSPGCPAPGPTCADLIDNVLSGVAQNTASPIKNEYVFTYSVPSARPTKAAPNRSFSVVARPFAPGISGRSTFCVDQTNVVKKDPTGIAVAATAFGCGAFAGSPL